MKPIDPRINPALVPPGSRAVVIAEKQDEYLDLPSVRTPAIMEDGVRKVPPYVITRWEPTDEERAALIRGEDVYVTLISSGSINPLFVTVGPTDWRR
jgi:hypothetical protein